MPVPIEVPLWPPEGVARTKLPCCCAASGAGVQSSGQVGRKVKASMPVGTTLRASTLLRHVSVERYGKLVSASVVMPVAE